MTVRYGASDALSSIGPLLNGFWGNYAAKSGQDPATGRSWIGFDPIIGVIDANVFIKNCLFLATKAKKADFRTDLRELLDSGVLVAYATPTVADEVERNLHKLSLSRGIDLKLLLGAWAVERRGVTFRYANDNSKSERFDALRHRDATDVPTALLAAELGAILVSSDDDRCSTDLPWVLQERFLPALREHARAKSVELSNYVTAYFCMRAGVDGVGRLLRVARSWPGEVQFAVGAALLAVLSEPGRAALIGDVIAGLAGRAVDQTQSSRAASTKRRAAAMSQIRR